MENQLLGPMESVKEDIIKALRDKGLSDDNMKPTEEERTRCANSTAYLLGICKALGVLSLDHHAAFAIEDSPTPVEKALVEMIESNEQMFRGRLPPKYRNKPAEEIELENSREDVVLCILATLSELETSMRMKYNEVVAEEKAKKKYEINKAKRALKKEKASRKASIDPPNDGPDKLDNVDLVTDKLDKVDLVTDKLDKVDLVIQQEARMEALKEKREKQQKLRQRRARKSRVAS